MKEENRNKRIAKNTLFLTLRMFITMGISIYSSRIILSALGVVDYGIYNVIGSVIAMLSFLNTSMMASTQRYINYSIGEHDYIKVSEVFNTSINLHIKLAILVALISEFVGLYFVNFRIVIPEERLFAANIVFQFTIITAVFNIISIPYKSLIVAYEKMSIYAYESIFQSISTLAISFLILYISNDKLIIYSFMNMIVIIIIRLFDGWYCDKKLSYKFKNIYNKDLSKQLLSFSSWSTLTMFGHVLYTQGTIFLINIFFGPAINAAQALANQINLSLLTFNSNYIMSVKPQITKSYAESDTVYMHKLITLSLKISCLIMSIVTIPFILKADYVLNLWLKEVPIYTKDFLILALFLSVIISFSDSITAAIQATGKIKNYHITELLSLLFILPFTYLFFENGFEPYSTYIIRIVIFFIMIFFRIYFISTLYKINYLIYLKPIIKSLISFIVSLIVLFYLNNIIPDDFVGLITLCLLTLMLNITFSYVISLNSNEKKVLYQFIKAKIIYKIIK